MVSKQISLRSKLIASAVSILVFVAAAELLLGGIQDRLYYAGKFFPQQGDQDFQQVFLKDTKLFWRFRPNSSTYSREFPGLTYRYNSLGMRGEELQQPKTGIRIAAFGNSCTFGWGVEEQVTYVRKLQLLLNKKQSDINFEVLNVGVPGYSSHQGMIVFTEQLPEMDLDLVLIMFGWNDHRVAFGGLPDSKLEMPGQIVLDVQNFVSRSNLYRLVRWIVLAITDDNERVAYDSREGTRRVPPSEFLGNLRSMVEFARARGIEPILVLPPIASIDGYFGGRKSNIHYLHEHYQSQIQLAALETNTPLVDLQPEFDKHNDLFLPGDPIHFNSRGHQIAAGLIYEQVQALLR